MPVAKCFLSLRKMSSMKTYIAMLRGINVSGQKKIKMADLKVYLEELGFEKVQTYIQSGNIIFSYPDEDYQRIEQLIASQIKAKYEFDVPVIVKVMDDFEYVVSHNPFLTKPNMEIERIYVTFLAETPKIEYLDKLNAMTFENEEFVIDGKYIYLYFSAGYGNAKLSNNFLESKLKVKATTRNWKTTNKLLEMAKTEA